MFSINLTDQYSTSLSLSLRRRKRRHQPSPTWTRGMQPPRVRLNQSLTISPYVYLEDTTEGHQPLP